MAIKKTLRSYSPDETMKIAAEIVKNPDFLSRVILLFGKLGSGKTTFVQGIAKGMGIKTLPQSPTYAYQRIYGEKRKLIHYDFYRLEKPDFGFWHDITEAVHDRDNQNLIVIEWPEVFLPYLRFPRTEIMLKLLDDGSRKITIATVDAG